MILRKSSGGLHLKKDKERVKLQMKESSISNIWGGRWTSSWWERRKAAGLRRSSWIDSCWSDSTDRRKIRQAERKDSARRGVRRSEIIQVRGDNHRTTNCRVAEGDDQTDGRLDLTFGQIRPFWAPPRHGQNCAQNGQKWWKAPYFKKFKSQTVPNPKVT